MNDTYGHAIGDHVLCMVAERCVGNLREVDILGRYGGEEFVVLLPETNLASASIVAERLCRLIGDKPVETEKGPVSVTVSLGVAPLDDACESFDALLERGRPGAVRGQGKRPGPGCGVGRRILEGVCQNSSTPTIISTSCEKLKSSG